MIMGKRICFFILIYRTLLLDIGEKGVYIMEQ